MLAGTSWAGGEELTIDVNQIMHFPALVVWGGGKSLHVIKRGGGYLWVGKKCYQSATVKLLPKPKLFQIVPSGHNEDKP